MFAKTKGYLLAALAILAIALPVAAETADSGITGRLAASLEKSDGTAVPVWVRFTDKGLTAAEAAAALDALAAEMPAKARKRRARGALGGRIANQADLPVNPAYLAEVARTGAVERRQSRWLNAASFNATFAQIEAISALPFVDTIDVVAQGVDPRRERSAEPPEEMKDLMEAALQDKSLGGLPYGASRAALDQIHVTGAHEMGLSGEGVTVAILDTGFQLNHQCLQHLDVVATWDFINDDDYVGLRKKDDPWQVFYGTASLSILAGYSTDNLIGPAYNASVILAKTEDISDETPAEEDNWIAALEWAEGLGADVVSSALGYYYWYDFSDMDGATALITAAAELAAARGVIVVNSVGDQGQSAEWNHILPPSDGRSVIGVGSCDLDGSVTYYSSPGPTADGRIKPDVLALGHGTNLAYDDVYDMYMYGYGTHYAVPLVAGTVALMVEHNPNLTPTQAADALRSTAGRAVLPDNNYGWGIVDAVAALNHGAPTIDHTPLIDNEGGIGAYPVTATIDAVEGLDEARSWVAWRLAGGNWSLATLAPEGGNVYTGMIPPQSRTGSDVEYYIVATDLTGRSTQLPAMAPRNVFSFRVGADTTPPVIEHVNLPDQVQASWPPVIKAYVSDNMEVAQVELMFSPNPGSQTGPHYLTRVGDHYEIPFPVEQIYAVPGLDFSYMLIARDNASVPNMTIHGSHEFSTVFDKGKVLVVDNRDFAKSDGISPRGKTAPPTPEDKSAADLAGWIRDAGFLVDVLDAAEADYSDFLAYDVVVISCGSNWLPLNHPSMRQAMIAWAEEGGRMVVEGGEVAYQCSLVPGYPDIMEKVLHIDRYFGEDGANQFVPSTMVDHPLMNRPHHIAGPLVIENSGGNDYGAVDLVDAAPEAIAATRTGYGSRIGGVVVYDDNTGPDSGQIVYLPFDPLRAPEADGRELIDNVLTYLMYQEPPGTGTISGTVILAGQQDHSGVTIRGGRDHSTVTAADGSFSLPGVWGGDYRVTAEIAGYGPQTRELTVTDGAETSGVEFYLLPVTEVQYAATPGISIPDNNPAGITDDIFVAEAGKVLGLSVDVDISHFAIGHLTVILTSPAGTSVTLHNRSGGTADNLVGNWTGSLFVDGPGSLVDFLEEPVQGIWTVAVADHQLGALGTLNSWGLNLLVTDKSATPADGTPPAVTRLMGNVPNPFNPRTTISFELARSGPVRLEVYDVKGRLVRTLGNRTYTAGQHSVVWDGRNRQDAETASGLYFFRMTTRDETQTKKMLLVR